MISDDNLICPICQEYFNNPVETECCGNGYCKNCLVQSLNVTRGTCPSCRRNLTIEKCRESKMVKRMVDSLPSVCTHFGCNASVARGDLDYHKKNCRFRPELQCELHHQPMTVTCLQDGQTICVVCALVGKHRTHLCLPSTFKMGCENIASISIQLKDPAFSFNTSTFCYWMSLSRQNYYQTMENLKTKQDIAEVEIPVQSSVKPLSLALETLSRENIPISVNNVKKYLSSIGVVVHPKLLEMVNYPTVATIFGGTKQIEFSSDIESSKISG